MFYLVFDFETTGITGGSPNNFPVQLACQLITETGTIIESFQTVIRGAKKLSDWTIKNCPHITIEKCMNEGIDIIEVLEKISTIIGDMECTLVAHNLEYDWDTVLLPIIKEHELENNKHFKKIAQLERKCTMLDDTHGLKYFHPRFKKYCGPKLCALAKRYHIDFDEKKAHDAMYDVDITRKCLSCILKDSTSKRKNDYLKTYSNKKSRYLEEAHGDPQLQPA